MVTFIRFVSFCSCCAARSAPSSPEEVAWKYGDYLVDPFRPNIQPNGFPNIEELIADRDQHLRRVKVMFEECDFFVFTLGLTEHWYSTSDGSVFPVCPGVAGGEFDPRKYSFGNQSVGEVVADFQAFLNEFRNINNRAQIILTVSPVPLATTAEMRHVLVSTTLSKSILRCACDEIVKQNNGIAYFPSYEIITGNYNRGRYYDSDLRSVTDEGVQLSCASS